MDLETALYTGYASERQYLEAERREMENADAAELVGEEAFRHKDAA